MRAFEIRAQARSALKNKWGKAALIIFCFFLIEFLISFVVSLLGEFNEILGFIASIANFVITIPLTCGLLNMFMKLLNNEDVKYFEFFNLGFTNFKKFWKVFGNILLKIWPYILGAVACIFLYTFLLGMGTVSVLLGGNFSILSLILALIAFGGYITLLIIAEIKTLLYYLAFPLAIDNPEMSAKETVNLSKELMYGNRGKLFCLFLSFIGWILLSILPYIILAALASIAFNIFSIILIVIGFASFIIAYCFLLAYIISAFIMFYKDKTTSTNIEVSSTIEEPITEVSNNNNE